MFSPCGSVQQAAARAGGFELRDTDVANFEPGRALLPFGHALPSDGKTKERFVPMVKRSQRRTTRIGTDPFF